MDLIADGSYVLFEVLFRSSIQISFYPRTKKGRTHTVGVYFWHVLIFRKRYNWPNCGTFERESICGIQLQVEVAVMYTGDQFGQITLKLEFILIFVAGSFVANPRNPRVKVGGRQQISLWRVLEVVDRALPMPE